tara:strand:+ start:468 stop:914 length:447 start_codon:yes stop_codon:yes gene_type:complete
MSITFDTTALNWYTHTIVKDGTTVSSPTAVGEVFFGTTKVWGVGAFSPETTLFNFSLAPDSNNLENAISTLNSTYSAAIKNAYYLEGPGQDTKWNLQLRKGYRMVTDDGTFTGNDSTYFWLYEGHSVTGVNTSHNGGTACSLRRDNGV